MFFSPLLVLSPTTFRTVILQGLDAWRLVGDNTNKGEKKDANEKKRVEAKSEGTEGVMCEAV